ncbi:MAG: thiamine ABC transporter substrate-binding protein [Acidimicrobiia bacterium]
MPRTITVALAAALVVAACSSTGGPPETTEAPTELTLLTHGSFIVSDDVWTAFEAETGITVEVVQAGDAGAVVNQAILTADDPTADVLFGVDTTLLSRALDAEIFTAYEAEGLDGVPDELVTSEFVTPIDFGDVCLNYDVDFFSGDLAPPDSLDDLVDPAYAGLTVVQNPATSSPGLAFVLATIAEYGEDGWEDWWASLAANDVRVTSGWEEAYYGDFTVAGGGDRPIVVSYATSPPAEVIFAEERPEEAPTAVVEASCFRQVEYAGILRPSESAEALVDFMLSPAFQEDIPLNMFVFPAVEDTPLPPEFVEFSVVPDDPLSLDPERIEEHRDEWIDRWTEIVLP